MTSIDLKCIFLNAENFFFFLDQDLPARFLEMSENEWQTQSKSLYKNKPLKKIRELTNLVDEQDPDIIMLAEVGGEESLRNWNRYFLKDRYSVALIEGNSDRSIDIGYLVHKRCPFHFSIETNKNRSLNFLYPHERNLQDNRNIVHKFSRDVAELHLFTSNKDKPFFVFLLAHLKSPLDPQGIDPYGKERRRAELETLLEIYLEHQKLQVPMAVVGDFNGIASRNQTEPEFTSLYTKTDLIDIFDLQGISPENRATFHTIKSNGKVESRQIDYCFLSNKAQKLLKAGSAKVLPYKNELGQFHQPKTMAEKELLPSDHYPIVFELVSLKTN